MRPLPGGYRRGRFRQARDSLERRSCNPMGRGREPLRRKARPAWPRPPARLPGPDLRRSHRRRAARKPGPSSGRPQARRVASDRDRSGRPPLLRRGRRAGHARARERSSPPAAGAPRAMGPCRNGRRSCHACRPAEGAARGAVESHRSGAQGPRHRRAHAGLRRARLRRRHRRRLDHDRRPLDRSHDAARSSPPSER